jgi:peptide/nickel transport system substrate-binding protein
MDKLINASVNEPGLQNLFNYETYASAQQPLIFFAGRNPFVIVRDRLHGIKDFVNPAGDFSPDQLYCTDAKGPNT